MRLLLRAPIVLSFTHPWARALGFLALSLLRATILTYFTYAAYVYLPVHHFGWIEQPINVIAAVIQIPIVVFDHTAGLLVPWLRSPLHFGVPTYIGFDGAIDPDAFRNAHLRTGIISYVLLFHAPSLIRRVRATFKRERPGSGA